MNIDTIVNYLMHALLAMPVIGVATLFVAMLLEILPSAQNRSHRFAHPITTPKAQTDSNDPSWARETPVPEARHGLASQRQQRLAAPSVLAQAALARARSTKSREVTA